MKEQFPTVLRGLSVSERVAVAAVLFGVLVSFPTWLSPKGKTNSRKPRSQYLRLA